MLRIRTILITALLMVGLTSLVPAAAGGPTSALLSVPGEARTASLYYTDADYEALSDLVGVGSATGVGTVDRSGTDHATGPGVTVTWLIHDVSPWRVDHIYLQGKGAPWIATQLMGETGSIWDNEAVWHQPRSGAELAALLDKLGVADAAREAGDFTGVAGAPVPAQNEPPAAGSAPAESSAPTESSAPRSLPSRTRARASGGGWSGCSSASSSPRSGCVPVARRMPTRTSRRSRSTTTPANHGQGSPRSCPGRRLADDLDGFARHPPPGPKCSWSTPCRRPWSLTVTASQSSLSMIVRTMHAPARITSARAGCNPGMVRRPAASRAR